MAVSTALRVVGVLGTESRAALRHSRSEAKARECNEEEALKVLNSRGQNTFSSRVLEFCRRPKETSAGPDQ
jgi:hypothetical protein